MLAIVEGCDLTGKSTFCRKLEGYGFKTIHFSQPQQDPLEEYLPNLARWPKHSVMDRFHLGERVYGPLYRGGSRLTTNGRRYVDLFIESRAGVLVLRDEPTETILERYDQRGETFLKREDIQCVRDAFLLEFNLSQISQKMLNPTPRELVTRCEHRATIWRQLQEFPQYLGVRYPTYLLVGDEPGPRQPNLGVPFVPFTGTCGHYLWEVLDDPEFRRVGVINSLDTDLRGVWRALATPRVVALGQKARARLVEARVPHGAVPHPQFARRFHHAKVEEYRMMIRQAANWSQSVTFRPVEVA